ncbi:MAG: hypothetical protein MZW92_77070 [Comamonadaceae bacterium]|nr:hypothetical protein [Comamonadaceae bacterium]
MLAAADRRARFSCSACCARRTQAPSSPLQYAGVGREPTAARGLCAVRSDARLRSVLRRTQPAASIPAGFDAEGFLRHAKLNFLRLQAAHDAGNHRGHPRVHHARNVRRNPARSAGPGRIGAADGCGDA